MNGIKNFIQVCNLVLYRSHTSKMKKADQCSLFQIISLGNDLHITFHDNQIELIDSQMNSLGSVESSVSYQTSNPDHQEYFSPVNYHSVFFEGRHYVIIDTKVFYLGSAGLCFIGTFGDDYIGSLNFVTFGNQLYVTEECTVKRVFEDRLEESKLNIPINDATFYQFGDVVLLEDSVDGEERYTISRVRVEEGVVKCDLIQESTDPIMTSFDLGGVVLCHNSWDNPSKYFAINMLDCTIQHFEGNQIIEQHQSSQVLEQLELREYGLIPTLEFYQQLANGEQLLQKAVQMLKEQMRKNLMETKGEEFTFLYLNKDKFTLSDQQLNFIKQNALIFLDNHPVYKAQQQQQEQLLQEQERLNALLQYEMDQQQQILYEQQLLLAELTTKGTQ
uniref:Uncharacterized protein n=1 Tax=Trepomonas sp. PC1 TaxID=1076344 RepID=A0A146K3I6_9EUKA|eukprot:JAP90161.1 Hypothetical protein TPC1_30344 [Trepomonas sp. PC1]